MLDVVSKASLNFQQRYGLLLDQTRNVKDLVNSLRKLGKYNGGFNVEKFLSMCHCGDTECRNLRDFEDHEEVVYMQAGYEVTLKEKQVPTRGGSSSVYPKLSDIAQSITKDLVDMIESYIPEGSMEPFAVLNPLEWPKNEVYPFSNNYGFKDHAIVNLYEILRQTTDAMKNLYSEDNYAEEVRSDWHNMLTALTKDKEWCAFIRGYDNIRLWKHYLDTNLIPPKMKMIVRNTLVIPVGR